MEQTVTTLKLQKKTYHQKRREERDRAIIKEYNRLVSIKGQSKTEVNKYLMGKYGIYSTSTLYAILKRAEQYKSKEETV